MTNTRAPQGTVLAPVLFSIYTDSCRGSFENIPIIKYADDTSIHALIKNDDVLNYYSEINMCVDWCKEHFLELNVKKPKELIFDFRQTNNSHEVVQIGSDSVEQ